MTAFDGRVSATTALIRLGFRDPAATRDALTGLDLWGPGGPVDAGATAVVTAIAEVADPDLAVQTLARLHEVQADPKQLNRALCQEAGLRSRLLGVLGVSTALGDHLVSHPGDWRVLGDDDLVVSRPSRHGLQCRLLKAVGAPADKELPWGTGGATAALTGSAAVEAQFASLRVAMV